MISEVIVLGCGPSGLLAAHAAVQAGLRVRILSSKRKSNIGGAQYLHMAIPDLTSEEPDGDLGFIYRGDKKSYAYKLYNNPSAPVSWGKYRGVVPIWNLRAAYGDLWDMFETTIEHRTLLPINLVGVGGPTTLVISTIPLTDICMRPHEHKFTSQQVWIGYRQVTPVDKESSNFIIYNGYAGDPLYRSSLIFSWRSDEYTRMPEGNARGHTTFVPVTKPLTNTCDCWPEIVKLGRYGKWDKEQLTHHAYLGAVGAIAELSRAV